jgi:acetyl-CoA C-acetyltransferase
MPLIAAWARSAVVPRHGAFKTLMPHALAAPVMAAVLSRAHISADDVDTVVVGNALGAGGNPARLVALHAGLPVTCRALTVDTQCCAGLDAVALGANLIQAGQAHVVLAGGVEAWSRSPIRMHRPLDAQDPPIPYERPAFAPSSEQDPDMLQAAAQHAMHVGWHRAVQDAYALASHQRAVAHAYALSGEIVPVQGVTRDLHPRTLSTQRIARLPEVVPRMSLLAVSPQADGAAFVLLLSGSAAQRFGLTPPIAWHAYVALGAPPEQPMLAATQATQELMRRAQLADLQSVAHIELHDAFAAQGLSFCETLHLQPTQINRLGGGLARGHPIGASGAVALVRVLSDVQLDPAPHAFGLATIAGAGGLGSAALVRKMG